MITENVCRFINGRKKKKKQKEKEREKHDK